MPAKSVKSPLRPRNGTQPDRSSQVSPPRSLLTVGSYIPWPSEDAMRRGRLAQFAVEGLVEQKVEEERQDMEVEEPKGPRRNPGRRATSLEARRRKMSEAGEPKPITFREKERDVDFELDLFNPDEET